MAKTLANINVNFVLAAEIGPGASELLNYHGIKVIMVKPGIGSCRSNKRKHVEV